MTPLGYRRIYAPPLPNGRRPAGELVPDEATAPLVRKLFARYAEGGWSSRQLAAWLNEQSPPIPAPKGGKWGATTIVRLLRNPVYIGQITYNRQHQGYYERATDADFFVTNGRHEPLIEEAVWRRVQERLTAAGRMPTYNRAQTKHGRVVLLGSGLFRCAGCGARMTAHAIPHRADAEYLCHGRRAGRTVCRTPSYRAPHADRALAYELGRLQRGDQPWDEVAEARLVGSDDRLAAQDARAQRQFAEERERLRKHTRLMSLMEDDPTPEQVATFREVSAEISGRIRALEAQLAQRSERVAELPSLRQLYDRVAETEVAGLVAGLLRQGDTLALRDLALALVSSARLVERWPAKATVWARVEVTWAPEVTTLLEAGLLRLGPERTLDEETRSAVQQERSRRGAALNAVRWGKGRQ
jgi:hypothetical protein